MAIDTKRIEKPARKIRKFLKKSPKRPNIEQIHDLRTSCRRFEADLGALGLSSKAKERRVLKDIASIRKRAGKIRDVDVLTGYALGIQVPGEQDCLVQLIENLGASRGKQVKKLRAFARDSGAQLRRRLKRTLSKAEKLLGKASKSKADENPNASEEIMTRALHSANELKSPAHLDKKNLHPYRLKVKELRYILQLSAESDQQRFVRKLGDVKDAIGEWHDWEELISIAEGVLDHGPKCQLLPKLHEISEAKYKRALAITNEMRTSCLPALAARSKGGSAQSKSSVSKFPVLSATAAISA
ncbi:MAG TPA: CHAD domain-containing protein [Candidatus Acidoferrales bacterium]|jgi:CHAD domain-containing protein|nr:CHAD domain-containing protein [Candidatus Acidoferrales bacterium]